jgi:hypothetical protein
VLYALGSRYAIALSEANGLGCSLSSSSASSGGREHRWQPIRTVCVPDETCLRAGCVGNFVFRAIEMLKKETSHGTTQTACYPGHHS